MKAIGKDAFKNSGIVGKVVIPASVLTVGRDAFKDCVGITEIHFMNPNTVITAGALPEGVKVCGIDGSTAQKAAENNKLTFVKIAALTVDPITDVEDNGNYTFTVENGIITGYQRKDASKPYSLKVTFPAIVNGEKITGIGSSVFEKGEELSSVFAIVIEEGITTIGDNAFQKAIKLTYIKLPKSLTSIGKSAFQDASLIGDIVLGESVAEIGTMAFKGNNLLSSLTVLNKTCVIKSAAFPKVSSFALYGYNGSTLARFAADNELTFISLDGEDNTNGENTDNAEKDNVGGLIDAPSDSDDTDNGVNILAHSNIAILLIIALALLVLLLILGVAFAFIVIKTKNN